MTTVSYIGLSLYVSLHNAMQFVFAYITLETISGIRFAVAFNRIINYRFNL